MARRILIPFLVIALFYLPVFSRYYLWVNDDSTDHFAHLDYIRKDNIPSYPLYHWSVLALSGGNQKFLCYGAAVALTLATAVSTGLSAAYLSSRVRHSAICLVLICFGLEMVMALPTFVLSADLYPSTWFPGPGVCLGQISPNVRHNPTTIFAMPFAVACFRVATRTMARFTLRSAAALGLMMALSLLAKPNYVLALIPCMGLVLLFSKVPIGDRLLGMAVTFIIPLFLLWGQVAVLVGPKGSATEELIIAPFEVWGNFTERTTRNIPLSAFVGVVFPLSVLILYRGRFDEEYDLKLAWGVLGVAVLEYVLLKEGGERATAGNWGWAQVFADHILFLVSCEFLLRQKVSWRQVVCFFVFFLHVLSGAVYLGRCMYDPRWSVFY